MMKKRLYRSNSDKMLTGVCSGIGEYIDLDPTLVRLLFVLVSLAYGSGVIAYIIAAIVIPEKPENYEYDDKEVEVFDKDGNKIESDPNKQKKTKQLIGIVLLGLGGFLLVDNLFTWFDRGVIWAIGIIAVGGFLLLKTSEKKEE